MPKINHEILKWLPIPLAPVPEQRRIVTKVDELMALCDRLEQQLTTVQSQTTRLLESILHHALNDRVCEVGECLAAQA
jgi:type I restriction enzyme, S subunit